MIRYLFPSILITIILWSCANPKPPTGGAEDVLAPQLDTTYPTQLATNIKTQTFQFVFDEKIQLNNLEQNLIITPAIDNEFKSVLKNNTLTLKFDTLFAANTTYTFNFGNSIKDVTEGNTTKTLSYTFSTGKFLDSLELNIKVYNPYNEQPCSECLIALYDASDTNSIINHTPLYFSYTDKSGKGKINHIKESQYDLYVLEDKNGNKLYDQNESIAFLDSSILLNENVTLNNILLQNTIERKQKHFKSLYINNLYKIQVTKGITNITILDTNYTLLQHTNNWYSDNYTYNFQYKEYLNQLNIITTDSLGHIDSLSIRVEEIEEITKLNVKLEQKEIRDNKLVLKFDQHITSIDTSKVYLSLDSIQHTIKGIKLDSQKLKATILLKAIPDSINKIFLDIDSNCFHGIISNNKYLSYNLSKYDPTQYGSISGKVNSNSSNTILQLLDSKYNIIESRINPSSYEFINLPADSYKLRLIIDQNKNGVWDPGNWIKREKPEKVVFHKDVINLRKNWEIKDINIQL